MMIEPSCLRFHARALLAMLALAPAPSAAQARDATAVPGLGQPGVERLRVGGWDVVIRRALPDASRAGQGLPARAASPVRRASIEGPIVTGALPPQAGVSPELAGLASFYWQGTETASGERFDPTMMTAAHRTLAFGTRVRVTHLASGRSVVVRINDRGPFKPGRVIDLSRGAAEALGMTGQGLARVRLDVL